MAEYVKTPFAIHEDSLELIVTVDLYLKLYINDYIPQSDMDPDSFTEASGGGYDDKHLNGLGSGTPAWTLESNDPRDVIAAEQQFDFTGPLNSEATIYGWYLITQDLATIKAAKRLDTPYTPGSGGGTLKFTPLIQAGNGVPE